MIAPAKQLSTLRQVSALVVVCTLFPTALAHAAIITRTAVFSGPEQTADVSIRANGQLSVNGSGQLNGVPLVVAPQTVAFQLDPNPFTASTHPTSGPVQFSVDDQTGQVVGFSGLNLDLFGGVPKPFHFQPFGVNITLGGSPAALPVTVEGQFLQLPFSQSENATISGNNFSVGGDADLVVDIAMKVVGFPVAQLSNSDLGDEFVTITGAISSVPLGGPSSRDVLVTLDGIASVGIAQRLFWPGDVSFTSGPLTFSGYRAADMQTTYAVDIHLQTVLVDAIVPEPTSLVSLATGLFLIGGCMALRGRQSSAV